MKTCENCGSKVYSGNCTWCDEEHFIDEQKNMIYEDIYERNEKIPINDNKHRDNKNE